MDQWEIVFSHMDRLGIMLHVVTQETENDRNLGGSAGLNPIRKLYCRELVARFSHHLAVLWNLGEENNTPDDDRKVIGHTGTQRTYYSFFYMDPRARTGVIAAFNTGGVDGAPPDTDAMRRRIRARVVN